MDTNSMPDNDVVANGKLAYNSPVLTALGSVQTFVLGAAGPAPDAGIEDGALS